MRRPGEYEGVSLDTSSVRSRSAAQAQVLACDPSIHALPPTVEAQLSSGV